MSKRSMKVYLLDILDEIERIERFFSSISSETELEKNELVYYATLKCLENIGEAVKHIPEKVKNLYPQIPWRQIVAFRNIIVHEYFGNSVPIVYDVVTNELPALKIVVKKILEEVENGG